MIFFLLSLLMPTEPPITGMASYYGEKYRGARMANGERFNPDAMTAASWDFPLGTRVKVTHASRSIFVTITDRGPTRKLRDEGRVIDLSESAFLKLAQTKRGLIEVTVEKVKGGAR